MHFMAGCASIAQSFMFPGERPTLIFVAFKAGLIDAFHAGGCPWPGINTVKIMAIRTAHFSLKNGMMIGKAKFHLFFHMAGETDLRILSGIYNIVFAAGGLRVDTAWTMAHFATLGRAISFFIGNARMSGKLELHAFFVMAGHTGFRAHIRGGF